MYKKSVLCYIYMIYYVFVCGNIILSYLAKLINHNTPLSPFSTLYYALSGIVNTYINM